MWGWYKGYQFDGQRSFLPKAPIQIAAIFAGTGSLTVDARKALQASAIFAGTGSLRVDSSTYLQASAIFAGTGSLRAAVFLGEAIAATFAGTGSLRVDSSTYLQAAARFAGVGNLTVQSGTYLQISARFAGTGSLSLFISQGVGVQWMIGAIFNGQGFFPNGPPPGYPGYGFGQLYNLRFLTDLGRIWTRTGLP
jgi:hypothetical protein